MRQGTVVRVDTGLYVQIESDHYTIHDEHGFIRIYDGEIDLLIGALMAARGTPQ